MGIEKKTSDFFFKPLNDEAALEKVYYIYLKGCWIFLWNINIHNINRPSIIWIK